MATDDCVGEEAGKRGADMGSVPYGGKEPLMDADGGGRP